MIVCKWQTKKKPMDRVDDCGRAQKKRGPAAILKELLEEKETRGFHNRSRSIDIPFADIMIIHVELRRFLCEEALSC